MAMDIWKHSAAIEEDLCNMQSHQDGLADLNAAMPDPKLCQPHTKRAEKSGILLRQFPPPFFSPSKSPSVIDMGRN